MQLSLHRDAYEPGIEINLSVITGYDDHKNPIVDSFSCSIDFFDRLLERLKKLPKGNSMVEFMGVQVKLSQHHVHFYSTTIYGDSSETEIKGVTMSLSELMMIPEEDLSRLTHVEAVKAYKDVRFPSGVSMTPNELADRIPWIKKTRYIAFKTETVTERHGGSFIHHLGNPDSNVTYFTQPVGKVEKIGEALNEAWRRHGTIDCYAFDADGNELAWLARDGSFLTDFATAKYGSEDSDTSWESMRRDTRFLVFKNGSDRLRVVIHEFELKAT